LQSIPSFGGIPDSEPINFPFSFLGNLIFSALILAPTFDLSCYHPVVGVSLRFAAFFFLALSSRKNLFSLFSRGIDEGAVDFFSGRLVALFLLFFCRGGKTALCDVASPGDRREVLTPFSSFIPRMVLKNGCSFPLLLSLQVRFYFPASLALSIGDGPCFTHFFCRWRRGTSCRSLTEIFVQRVAAAGATVSPHP